MNSEKHSSAKEYMTFDEFWPAYLARHCDPEEQRLRAFGTSAAIGVLGLAAAKRSVMLLAIAPLVAGLPVWIGHVTSRRRHTRGLSAQYPRWAVRADVKLTRLMATGQLEDELARHRIFANPEIIDIHDASTS